ncbi:FAD-dependent oxidoreductase [Nocardia farcinica]|uniref:NAD(P)/FAD-dependent oxidoreductase n=1 Tax=Nocardia farcinica TaxID=37329 RepID=UPI0018934A8A|nr:FAD-dependent oxidoreductase [Nocardia farcinica]MBF6258377.1 FAD-dependent oxidoreductase [Nocardia farcinica]
MNHPRTIAIVGASAAGVAAACAIRKGGFAGEVSIFDSDAHLPYERPPLSKAISKEGLPLRDIVSAGTYSELDLTLRLGVRVDSLDAANRSLRLQDRSMEPFDQVLIATGGLPRTITVRGVDLENVLYLRNADDASQLAGRLAAGGPLVVVGAGFIGLELAAVARSLDVDVTVIDNAPLPLLGSVGAEVAELFRDMHAARGVRLLMQTAVSELRGSGYVEEVVLQDGRILPASTVVVGVGVVPNTGLARSAGLSCDDGIDVNAHGRTANPWIWAAGDAAIRKHSRLRRRARIEHWDTAQRHGAAVGQSMIGVETEESSVPYVWSDQYGLTYQAFGRREPSDMVVFRRGSTPENFLAFWIEDDRVQAAAGIGHPRELRAARSLIETQQRISPEVLQDPDSNIRAISQTASAASGKVGTGTATVGDGLTIGG